MRKFVLGICTVFLFATSLFADNVSVSGGVQVTNSYYLRGLKQETVGTIVQPSADLTLDLYRNDKAFVSDVRAIGGIWESVQATGVNSQTGNVSAWFESDVYGGFGTTVAKTLNVDGYWLGVTSPSGEFEAVQELDVKVSINDFDLWKDTFFGQKLSGFTGFHPYALYAYELAGHTAGRLVGNNETGAGYLELGINPGACVYHDVKLSLPVKVGFSTNNYYNEGGGFNYGYSSVGLQLEVPVITHVYFVVGADADFLGNDVKLINADNKNVEVNGHVGLSFKF